MKLSCVATLLTVTLFAVGCGTDKSSGVAVVDLDRVASELGRDAVMVRQLQQQQSGLSQQLAAVKNNFEKQIAESYEKLPETPEEEEVKKLLNMKRNANIQLASYQKQASNALGQMKNSVIAEFRAEALPVARQVANERGLAVVLTTNDSVVFAFDKSVDITDAVIAELQKTAPKRSTTLADASQKPALKAPPAPKTGETTPAKPQQSTDKVPAETK